MQKHERENVYLREGLQALIIAHGVDVVACITNLTPRTVCEYAGRSARVMPLGKFEAAKRALAEYEHKAEVDD